MSLTSKILATFFIASAIGVTLFAIFKGEEYHISTEGYVTLSIVVLSALWSAGLLLYEHWLDLKHQNSTKKTEPPPPPIEEWEEMAYHDVCKREHSSPN